MKVTASAKKLHQQVRARLRMVHHYEQVSKNVCQTCRFFGISRTQFYVWLWRYREARLAGLHDRQRGPHTSPLKIPPYIEALIMRIVAGKKKTLGDIKSLSWERRMLYRLVFLCCTIGILPLIGMAGFGAIVQPLLLLFTAAVEAWIKGAGEVGRPRWQHCPS